MSDAAVVMAIILAYLGGTLAVGVWAHRRSRATVEDYFLANRRVGTLVLFFTLAATNFSAFFFLGFAGASYRLGYGFYGFMAFGTGLVGLTFFVVGRKVWLLGQARGYVTPGELVTGQTGSRPLGWIFTAVMVIFTLPYLAVQPYAAGLVLEALTDGAVARFTGAALLTAFMVTYVFLGGMRSSTLTDLLQGIMMCLLLAVAVGVVVAALGGFGQAGEDLWEEDDYSFVDENGAEYGAWEELDVMCYVCRVDFEVQSETPTLVNASIETRLNNIRSASIQGNVSILVFQGDINDVPQERLIHFNLSKGEQLIIHEWFWLEKGQRDIQANFRLNIDTEPRLSLNLTLQKSEPYKPLFIREGGPVTVKMWFSYTILWVMVVPMFPQLFTRFYIPKSQKQLMRAAVAYPLLVPFLFLAPVVLGVFGHLSFSGLDKLGSDNILPKLMVEHAPLWLAALVMAGGLAAFMSTADSQLLALSSMVTRDGVAAAKPEMSDRQQFWTGRLLVVILALVGLALAYDPPDTIFAIVSQAFTGLAVLFPTTLAVLYWDRLRPAAAMASVVVGEALVATSYWLSRSGEALPDWFLRGFHPALPIVAVAIGVLVGVNYGLEAVGGRGKGESNTP